MNAEQFHNEFTALMDRAVNSGEIPVYNMIMELDAAHHKMLHLAINAEAQAVANKIIPANRLPPMPNGK